jgi:hypothetical protein
MPHLTESRIRVAKASDKPYKLFDERGLHMLVTPQGGRLWRLRYWLEGRAAADLGRVSGRAAEARAGEAR